MFILNTLYKLLNEITEYALNELYDEQEIKRKLLDLAVLFELNEITEEEYELSERKLLNQLREAREYNKAMAEEEDEETEEEDEAEQEDGEGDEAEQEDEETEEEDGEAE